jgi:hypothetical protein
MLVVLAPAVAAVAAAAAAAAAAAPSPLHSVPFLEGLLSVPLLLPPVVDPLFPVLQARWVASVLPQVCLWGELFGQCRPAQRENGAAESRS